MPCRKPSARRSVIPDGKWSRCRVMAVSPCCMGDLLSLRQLDLPVKIIVFKNDSLAFVELEMKAAGFLDFGTDLHNPDFAKMAEAAGLLGLTADTPDQVRPMLTQALEHDGPALVEVAVSPAGTLHAADDHAWSR